MANTNKHIPHISDSELFKEHFGQPLYCFDTTRLEYVLSTDLYECEFCPISALADAIAAEAIACGNPVEFLRDCGERLHDLADNIKDVAAEAERRIAAAKVLLSIAQRDPSCVLGKAMRRAVMY